MDQVVECRDCHMQYVNPRLRPEIVIQGYSDAEDPTFVKQNPERIKTFALMLRKAFPDPAQRNEKKLLDIGCAGGACLVAATSAGFAPVGVEPSRWLADFGRKTYNVDIRDGILVAGMFPPASFDVITIWDVIEHVPDPRAVFELIHSLLKPNGTLLLSYPDAGSYAARLLGEKWPFWLSVHLHYYTRDTIAKHLSMSGFRTLSWHPLWQMLRLSYVLRRAGEYFSPFHAAARLTEISGLGNLSCSYQMGQTWIIARKESPEGSSR